MGMCEPGGHTGRHTVDTVLRWSMVVYLVTDMLAFPREMSIPGIEKEMTRCCLPRSVNS